jgi:hypothetical protein
MALTFLQAETLAAPTCTAIFPKKSRDASSRSPS